MFTNVTVIDKKAIYALNRKTFLNMLFCFAFALIVLTCAISLSILNYKHQAIWYILFALCVFLGLYLLYAYIKAQKASVGQTTEYIFEQEHFKVKTDKGCSELSYSIVQSTKIYGDFLFLYLNKSQAYIVNLTQMPQEFLTFINQAILDIQ